MDQELQQVQDWRVAPTANRSAVGIMNEFNHLAEAWRDGRPKPDLHALALRLATTPCGPLHRKHISPDRELAALLHSIAQVTSHGGVDDRRRHSALTGSCELA